MYGKIVTRAYIISQARLMKSTGRKIVFTNGCFDILHYGHINYLVSARSLGDILIVGLNRDTSVRDLKGPGRPINDETARAEVLSALQCVDYVVLFNEPTPAELISEIKPNVLVKGGDYKIENVAGADFVRSSGGEVILLPFEKGYSTSEIIGKIKGD